MPWTWDPAKNEENQQKHSISFRIARLVFRDDACVTYDDPYPYESRFRTIGAVGNVMLLVVHTEEEPDPQTGERSGRIISARKANRRERSLYEEK